MIGLLRNGILLLAGFAAGIQIKPGYTFPILPPEEAKKVQVMFVKSRDDPKYPVCDPNPICTSASPQTGVKELLKKLQLEGYIETDVLKLTDENGKELKNELSISELPHCRDQCARIIFS